MLQRLLETIERTPLRASSFVAAFAALVIVRGLIESFSAGSGSGFLSLDPSTLLHYGSYFLAVYLCLALVLGSTGRDYAAAFKVALFGMLVIWLPPLIDLAASGGAETPMSYLLREPSELLTAFISLANPFLEGGPTLGQKVATTILFALTAFYAFLKGRGVFIALRSVVFLYGALFVLGTLPSLAYAVALLFGTPALGIIAFLTEAIQNSTLSHASFPALSSPSSVTTLLESGFNLGIAGAFSVISGVAGGFLLSRALPSFRAHLSNFRPLRVLHFLVLIASGAFVAFVGGATVHVADLLPTLSLLLAWCAACYFAVAINDLEDEEIDKVSSPERPLPSGTVSREGMQDAATLSFATLLFVGFSAGYYPLFFVLAFTASYYAYSASPFRLKRVPILSSVLIGFAALSAVCAGYFLLYRGQEFGAFPFSYAAGIVIFYTLFSHFRDLKDIEGDTKAGVPTVAALFAKRFGERGAFQGIGLIVGVAFLSTPLFFPVPLLLGVASALLAYTICVRRPYIERHLFILFFVVLLSAAYFALR